MTGGTMKTQVQEIPCKAIEEALRSFNLVKEIPEDYSMSVEEDGDVWSFIFLPMNRRWRGGDVEVRIAKDSLEVIEVVQGQ